MFPTTLSAQLPGYATGDAAASTSTRRRRRRHDGRLRSRRTDHVQPGERQTVYVRLDCGGDACVVDGGTGDADGGMPDDQPALRQRARRSGRDLRHRDRRRAIPARARRRATTTSLARRDTPHRQRLHRECSARGDPRATPATTAARPAPATTATIRTATARRPAATASSIRARPATRRSRAASLGACPTTSDCRPVTPAPTTHAGVGRHLLGRLRCAIRSSRRRARTADSCCPPGATHDSRHRLPGRVRQRRDRTSRRDVRPRASRRSRRAPARPAATTATPAPSTTSRPSAARPCVPALPDHDADLGRRLLSAEGATNATDTDCPPVCGNGVVERGETCDGDSARRRCPAPPPDVVGRRGLPAREVVGDADDCTARCEVTEIDDVRARPTAAVRPAARSQNDPDCSPACGDGFDRAVTAARNATPARRAGSSPAAARRRATTTNPCTDDAWSAPAPARRGACTCRSPSSAPATAAASPGATFYARPRLPRHVRQRHRRAAGRDLRLRRTAHGRVPTPEACPSERRCTRYALTGRRRQLQRDLRRDADHRLRRRRRLLPAGLHRGRRQRLPGDLRRRRGRNQRELRPRDHRGPAGRLPPHLRRRRRLHVRPGVGVGRGLLAHLQPPAASPAASPTTAAARTAAPPTTTATAPRTAATVGSARARPAIPPAPARPPARTTAIRARPSS